MQPHSALWLPGGRGRKAQRRNFLACELLTLMPSFEMSENKLVNTFARTLAPPAAIEACFSAAQTSHTAHSTPRRRSQASCCRPTSNGPTCLRTWGTQDGHRPCSGSLAAQRRRCSAGAAASRQEAPRRRSLAGCGQGRWRRPAPPRWTSPTRRRRSKKRGSEASSRRRPTQPAAVGAVSGMRGGG